MIIATGYLPNCALLTTITKSGFENSIPMPYNLTRESYEPLRMREVRMFSAHWTRHERSPCPTVSRPELPSTMSGEDCPTEAATTTAATEPEDTGPCASCTHLSGPGTSSHVMEAGKKCEPGKTGWRQHVCFEQESMQQCRKFSAKYAEMIPCKVS